MPDISLHRLFTRRTYSFIVIAGVLFDMRGKAVQLHFSKIHTEIMRKLLRTNCYLYRASQRKETAVRGTRNW